MKETWSHFPGLYQDIDFFRHTGLCFSIKEKQRLNTLFHLVTQTQLCEILHNMVVVIKLNSVCVSYLRKMCTKLAENSSVRQQEGDESVAVLQKCLEFDLLCMCFL
jgi:hypothetical protein